MASAFTKVVANFITNLNSNIAIGSTTASLASNLTKEGVAIPDGRYCFTVNQGKSNEQHFVCNVVGTAISGIQNVDRLGNLTDGASQAAKINDEIKITDYVNLKYLVDDVDALNAIIAGLIVAGAPDASTTVKGVSRLTASSDKTLGTATITVASPAVVTLNNHGLTVDDSIRFTTTGALPTGLTVGTKYYVISAGLTTNTFRLSATQGGTAINTSGTQSGVHTLYRTTPRAVSDTDTTLLPTASEKTALGGSQGAPGSTNKYITQDNVTDASSDQTQTTQNGSVEIGEANTTLRKNKNAQSFIPVKTKMRGVKLYKAADTGTFTGTVTVSLQADSAGNPSGSDLATATFTNPQWLALSTGEIAAYFASEYTSLVPGNTYWIVITSSTSDTLNHPNIGINTAGGYANGSNKYWNTTDGWVANGTNDLYFKTLVGITNQVVTTDATGKIPADVYNAPTYNAGTVSAYNINTGTQTIPHGLGKVPSRVFVSAVMSNNTTNTNFAKIARAQCILIGGVARSEYIAMQAGTASSSNGSFSKSGTTFTLYVVGSGGNNGDNTGVVTVDATNIYIAWTNSGAGGAADITWEVQ